MKSDTYKILFSLVILNTLMSPGYKLSLSIQHCFSALYVSVYMFFISPVCSPCTSLCFVSFVFFPLLACHHVLCQGGDNSASQAEGGALRQMKSK